MLRPLRGFKAKYHDFMLVVSADFDEWRVLAMGPGFTVQGQRQFSEAKAKEHALQAASSYLKEKGADLSGDTPPEWTALASGEWMDYRP